MKTIVLAAAAAMTLAGPVLAADSHVNFAINHFAQDHETGDGPRARVLTGSKVSVSTKNAPSGHAAFALEHFAQDRETGDGPRVRITKGSNVSISTKDNKLAAYAAEKLRNDERGDN